eukprot:TRINITY_DN4017_c0_g1_i1.p2 TRINITY_DN4017_c0_g1~~TRINITY_DN4017_c0_g1_i1.p2  ORF type:complete len:144 (+),score=28.14 TRINITY_DN4017_c0_g1_i1:3-434(+)
MRVDLFEKKNMTRGVQCTPALARPPPPVPGYNAPRVGVKLAAENRRNFDEETLRAGQNVMSRQTAGSHGGATAAGMIDKSRNIVKLEGGSASTQVPVNRAGGGGSPARSEGGGGGGGAKFCGNCGTKQTPGGKFCGNCGNPSA